MNCYSRLTDLKAEYQGRGSGESNDIVLLRTLERVSRAFDELTRRHFFSVRATRYYDGPGRESDQLWLRDDLIEVTTLKVDEDGDGTFEITLAADDDYWLWPDNQSPKNRIDLNPKSAVLNEFSCGRRRLEVAGVFGYSDEVEATGLTGTLSDATDTSLAASADASALISPGDTLVIEDEQVDVTLPLVSGTAVTVVRGINGTTPAAHTAQPIFRRRFPRDVEQAAVMQAARFAREVQTGYGGRVGSSEVGGYEFTRMYPAIRDLMRPYVVPPRVVATGAR